MNESEPVHQHTPIHPDAVMAESDALFAEGNTKGEVTFEKMVTTPGHEVQCLVEPFLQQVGLACLAGSSDTGKSTILRQLSMAVAAGDNHFLGWPLHSRHRSAIYVSTEDGYDITRSMMLRQSHRYSTAQRLRLRYIFDTEQLLPLLAANLAEMPADLVVIDCFSDVFGGDLKDTQKIRTFLQPFHLLAEQHRCLVLFLHHTGKRTESLPPSKNNLLSGQGLEAKMRLVVELRRDPRMPYLRHFCIVKGNYLPSQQKSESHVLHFDEATGLFTHTGQHTPYELLARSSDPDEGRAKYEQALELKKEGKSYAQIAEVMGYASKNSITQIFEKAKKLGINMEKSELDAEE